MFGASKACAVGQTECSGYTWPAYLIEGVHKGQSIVTL